ncbi:hypothetical protein [Microbacterium excoecariae]|uniref:hypothetical protein n=1 Tax=Microbacterium excoecariae TaxID=2715210 RepID=UPI001408F011|nr:hypothetical protein [Microbacterium excoecariae]NHI16871.1 hypothetical protein [Microbacterium excoecariae]
MALDPVPWFVGGGAEHSPEVARLLAYAGTSGAEGIVSVGDLTVEPLAVPGTAVQVLPGAALVRNRAAGGDQQTYVARNPVSAQVDVAATGSGAGRSDLIVLRVEDPNMAGEPWQAPTDPASGPYVFLRVVSGVPAGTTRLQDVSGYAGQSAITLARVDVPASTGTITAGMITDLRQVAIPRRETRMFTFNPPDERYFNAGSSAWDGWPLQGSDSMGLFDQVEIPEWATHFQAVVSYTGVLAEGNTWGRTRLLIGDDPQLNVQATFNTPSAGDLIFVMQAAEKGQVPAGLRGVTAPMRLQGRLDSTSIPASRGPWSTPYTRVVVQIEFEERAA